MIYKLAFRNLSRNKRRSLITVLSISGGMMFSMLFTGFQDGTYSNLIDLAARSGSGHLTLEHREYRDDPDIKNSIGDYRQLEARLQQVSGVTAYALRIKGNGMLASAYGSAGVFFDAVDPKVELDISPLAKEIVRGSFLQSEAPRSILIGDLLAKKLKVDVGSKLVLTANDKSNETVQELLRVAGIFHVGSELFDGFYLLMQLPTAQRLLGLASHEVSQVAVFLPSFRQIPPVQQDLRAQLSDFGQLSLHTWREVMRDLANYIAMDRAWNYVLQLMVFLIIAAGILNTVLMSVLERRFEFGVMLAVGTSPIRLFLLVLAETSLIGLLGILFGSLLGWGVNGLFQRFPLDLQWFTDEEISISGFAFEPVLRTGIFVEHYLITVLLIYLLVVLVGIYPALKAARFVPVEALRGP